MSEQHVRCWCHKTIHIHCKSALIFAPVITSLLFVKKWRQHLRQVFVVFAMYVVKELCDDVVVLCLWWPLLEASPNWLTSEHHTLPTGMWFHHILFTLPKLPLSREIHNLKDSEGTHFQPLWGSIEGMHFTAREPSSYNGNNIKYILS